MKKLLHVPPGVITYLLIIMLIRQPCSLSEGKAMAQHTKERTNYFGNEMAPPAIIWSKKGRLAAGRELILTNGLKSGAPGPGIW